MDGMNGYGFFPGLAIVLFWGLIIWLIFELIRRSRFLDNNEHRGSTHAMDILKERLAKGEIDKHEFEEKKKLLD